MKAATFSRFGAPDVLAVVDVPDRMPGYGEARIRVEAASVVAAAYQAVGDGQAGRVVLRPQG
jgi:NADPH:quinone reductase-like Zn-dependent oxidoreductase